MFCITFNIYNTRQTKSVLDLSQIEIPRMNSVYTNIGPEGDEAYREQSSDWIHNVLSLEIRAIPANT